MQSTKEQEEPEDNTDLLTFQAVAIMNDDDYGFMMERLRDKLDKMIKILPPFPDESPEDHILRQDSLIALAINNIHEDEHRGLGYLITSEDVDIDRIFGEVFKELERMNYSQQSSKWSALALKSAGSKNASPTIG